MIRKIILVILIGFIMALSINTALAADNTTMDTTLKSSNADADTGLKTFTDLSNEIKNAKPDSQVYLKGTYKYDKKTDALLKNGVWITKDITIVGQKGCTIDGSSLARCFNIKKDCNVKLENVKIKNGYTTENGAGVKLYSNSKLIIKNCAFENNIAKNSNGGAIEAKKSCTIKIYSSSFKNNKATSTTKSLGDDKRGMGSVIKTSVGTTLVIKDSKFSSNEAFLSMILVVSESGKLKKTSTINIDKCTFTKNKSQHNGVVYSDEYGKCTIKNSRFSHNHSPKGAGTIVVESSKYALIKNCEFYKNKGCNGAGVNVKIYKHNDNSNVRIIGCKFSHNTASMYGGAVCSVGGKVIIKKSEFKHNRASIFGGAVYARLGKLDVSSSKFKYNKACYAGALCLACKKSTVKHSSITNNKAYYLYSSVYNIKHNKLIKCHVKANKNLKYSKIHLHKSGKYIKVKVTNYKDEPVKKRVKLVFTGSKKITTKWYKTSKKKSIKIKIPKSLKGECKVTMKVKNAKYFKKTIDIKA